MARNTGKIREQHKSILIALEDEKSSRYYIRDLIKDKGVSGNVVFAEHIGTDPNSVLKAISKFEVDNPYTKYEKAWLVIDRDSFSKSNFNGTLATAIQKEICVAYSNECYELWLLLHFKDVTGPRTRKDIKEELNKEFLKNFNFKYEKSEKHVYGMIIDRQNDAIKRATDLIKNIIKHNGKLDPSTDNPSTKMHILVNCLNNLKQCKKNNFNKCNDYT